MIRTKRSSRVHASLKQWFLRILVALQLVSILACGRINDEWHRYGHEQAIVTGGHAEQATITSHGWRIIDKTKDDSGPAYEWGWEIVLEAKGPKQTPRVFYGIKRIEYTLYDKDGFELAKSAIPNEGLVHELGTTDAYRHTSTMTVEKAKRAYSGSCVVELES